MQIELSGSFSMLAQLSLSLAQLSPSLYNYLFSFPLLNKYKCMQLVNAKLCCLKLE